MKKTSAGCSLGAAKQANDSLFQPLGSIGCSCWKRDLQIYVEVGYHTRQSVMPSSAFLFDPFKTALEQF
jgi:hypothetical protein